MTYLMDIGHVINVALFFMVVEEQCIKGIVLKDQGYNPLVYHFGPKEAELIRKRLIEESSIQNSPRDLTLEVLNELVPQEQDKPKQERE